MAAGAVAAAAAGLGGLGQQARWLSNKPEHAVYSGPKSPSPKRVTLRTLRDKYQRGEPISMVTAYDYPSAVHVCPRLEGSHRWGVREGAQTAHLRLDLWDLPIHTLPGITLHPSACSCTVQVDQAGIDMLLVGDSVAMVVHGHDTTLPVTVEEMLVHCRAVSRGAHRRALAFCAPAGWLGWMSGGVNGWLCALRSVCAQSAACAPAHP